MNVCMCVYDTIGTSIWTHSRLSVWRKRGKERKVAHNKHSKCYMIPFM